MLLTVPCTTAPRRTTTIFIDDAAAIRDAPPDDGWASKEQRLSLLLFGLFAPALWSYVMWRYGADILGAIDSSSGEFASGASAVPLHLVG